MSSFKFRNKQTNKTDFSNNEHAVAIVFDFEKSYDTNVKIPFYDTNVKYPILHETNIKNLIWHDTNIKYLILLHT